MVTEELAAVTALRPRQPRAPRPHGQPKPDGVIEGGCPGARCTVTRLGGHFSRRLGAGGKNSALGLTQACGWGVPGLVPRLSQPQAALGRCSVEAPAALLDTEM